MLAGRDPDQCVGHFFRRLGGVEGACVGETVELAGAAGGIAHHPVAHRSFERRFALADHIQVRGADLKDGLLAIELVREIPEAMKPKKINIGSGSEARQDRSAIGGGEQPASRQTVDAEAEHA